MCRRVNPQYRVIWCLVREVPFQICEENEAGRLDASLLKPLKHWAEVSSTPAYRGVLHFITIQELVHTMHGGVTVADVQLLRTNLFGDCLDLRIEGGAQL